MGFAKGIIVGSVGVGIMVIVTLMLIPTSENIDSQIPTPQKEIETINPKVVEPIIPTEKEVKIITPSKEDESTTTQKEIEPILSNTPSPTSEKISEIKPQICKGTAICTTETVTKIIDGDTLYTKSFKIRISLTNTPELNQKGFSEATQFTSNLCPEGSIITIDQDDLQPYDKYGRLLAKIFCGDKVLNSELLYNNLADISTEFCSTSEFSSEIWAQQYGCSTENQEITSKISNVVPPPAPDNESNCDASYPDVCIKPYPPDLDCKDVPYKKFKVLPPDPHRFDVDKDGIGCE